MAAMQGGQIQAKAMGLKHLASEEQNARSSLYFVISDDKLLFL